jgi:hypothetical protein
VFESARSDVMVQCCRYQVDTSAFVTFATTKRAYAALKTFNRKQKLRQKINGPEVQRAPRAYNIVSPCATTYCMRVIRLTAADLGEPR